ncbi:hypothetical protein B0H21DRAFT_713786 [Amylocystis lapponica]|nr:hypothetical protein B0H21DRAFT_713786 [Amylocystis lapponica]
MDHAERRRARQNRWWTEWNVDDRVNEGVFPDDSWWMETDPFEFYVATGEVRKRRDASEDEDEDVRPRQAKVPRLEERASEPGRSGSPSSCKSTFTPQSPSRSTAPPRKKSVRIEEHRQPAEEDGIDDEDEEVDQLNDDDDDVDSVVVGGSQSGDRRRGQGSEAELPPMSNCRKCRDGSSEGSPSGAVGTASWNRPPCTNCPGGICLISTKQSGKGGGGACDRCHSRKIPCKSRERRKQRRVQRRRSRSRAPVTVAVAQPESDIGHTERVSQSPASQKPTRRASVSKATAPKPAPTPVTPKPAAKPAAKPCCKAAPKQLRSRLRSQLLQRSRCKVRCLCFEGYRPKPPPKAPAQKGPAKSAASKKALYAHCFEGAGSLVRTRLIHASSQMN